MLLAAGPHKRYSLGLGSTKQKKQKKKGGGILEV